MANEILPWVDILQREKISLQKGMNFRAGGDYSIILMSRHPNAPYRDAIDDRGHLIYEGHDVSKNKNVDPKIVDQPMFTRSGKLTENGKFFHAATAYARDAGKLPERVQVYEKIRPGIWADNGRMALTDAWMEDDGQRKVFKFRLEPLAPSEENLPAPEYHEQPQRMIPSHVKLEVWQRDKGKCRLCGATQNLHFDHILPFSKGGTSTNAANVQLLCARHNLQKSAKIE